MKYMGSMCAWIYDEEIGDPENGITPEQSTGIFRSSTIASFAERIKAAFIRVMRNKMNGLFKTDSLFFCESSKAFD